MFLRRRYIRHCERGEAIQIRRTRRPRIVVADALRDDGPREVEFVMRATVKKWGNSAAVRMPAAVMEEAKLEIDQSVEVRVEDGRVVIEPIAAPEFALDALLASVTRDNLHEEEDFGPPVGREAF
jgi:antitoxin MazE